MGIAVINFNKKIKMEMKKVILFALMALTAMTTEAQTVIHTEDVTHFWQTFDSLQTTNDKEKQVVFVQKYYLDKASVGLKYTTKPTFADTTFTAKDWLESILDNKEKFQRIRPFTLANLENQKTILQAKFQYFKELYPEFRGVEVYFVVGLGLFGGNVDGRKLIIGSEVMAKDTPDWGISIVLHEFVHTLQTLRNDALLQHCILEGTADFVAEMVNQKSLTETYPGGYIDFGNKNEKAVWKEFKKYIGSSETETDGKFYDWIYGSKGREIDGVQMGDLGYFVGYTFCRAYYKNAKDKKKALKEIIEWDLSTPEKAKDFLLKSGYVPKEDLKFVQNLKFAPVVEVKKSVKKELYGYKLTKDEVVFIYELGKAEDVKVIEKLTVAGSFNGWNPNDDNYKMTSKNRTFELHLPKSKFEKGKEYQFKFVKNTANWLSVPDKALNVDANSGNLTVQFN